MLERHVAKSNSREMPDYAIEELLRVGIAPSPDYAPVGSTFLLGSNHIMEITGYATREEFLERAEQAGLGHIGLEDVPTEGVYFARFKAVSAPPKDQGWSFNYRRHA